MLTDCLRSCAAKSALKFADDGATGIIVRDDDETRLGFVNSWTSRKRVVCARPTVRYSRNSVTCVDRGIMVIRPIGIVIIVGFFFDFTNFFRCHF